MATHYAFTVRGHLDERWSDWFDGLTITNRADGNLVLDGPIADQAALYGVLARLRDLGLSLIAVQPLSAPADAAKTQPTAYS